VKVKIQVIIESDDGRVQDVEEVACLKRGTLTPEELGLNLAEAKEILQGVQRSMVWAYPPFPRKVIESNDR
jgi:hypothetical protein